MSVNRTPELLAHVKEWADVFTDSVAKGQRSHRTQWDVEGTDEPLTLYANRSGTFIVEPGCKPVPVQEWLER